MSIEKRHAVRHQVRVPCRIIYDGIQVKGVLTDLSLNGAGIEGSLPFINEGKKLTLEVDTGQAGENRFISFDLEIKNYQRNSAVERFGGALQNLNENFQKWLHKILQSIRPSHSYFMKFAQNS